MFGFVNIYKPKGYTSFDVIACLRKITKIRQIGHSGTLDPFAQGVLPIAVGKATKLIEYLDSDKIYLATIQFGANTDTYDLEGEVTDKYSKNVKLEEIIPVLKDFEGEIEQIPPMYSAIKVNGKKLYEYARKGQNVEIKPRKVKISKIELVDFDFENQQCKIRVHCGGGVYIRSIAHDLGQKLNCGGYLIELIREKSGSFEITNSVQLDNLKESHDVEQNIINPLNVINIPSVELSEDEKNMVLHGMSIPNKNYDCNMVVFLTYGGKIYAIGQVEELKIKVKKVFGL